METTHTTAKAMKSCSTTLQKSSNRPTKEQYLNMKHRMCTLREIDNNLNLIRAHVDFLINSDQFDQIEEVRTSLCSFLDEMYVNYESSYEK